MPDQSAIRASGPDRQLLQADDVRSVRGRRARSSSEVARAARRVGVAVEHVPAPDDEPHGPRLRVPSPLRRCASSSPTHPPSRRRTTTSSPPRWRARAREVELVTSRFRFGERPRPTATASSSASTRGRAASSAAHAAAAAAEGAGAPVRAAARSRRPAATSLHLQWLAVAASSTGVAPLPDGRSVFTAHDLLPRRTAGTHAPLARALRALRPRRRPLRARPRDAGRRSASTAAKLRVIPHPVFRSDPPRADDGRTRARARRDPRRTRGSPDAVEAVLRRPGRAAARRRRPPRSRSTSSARRPGTAPSGASATSAARSSSARSSRGDRRRFPVRAPSSTSPARCLQALGAGVPAVVYDVGGLGEVGARVRGGPGRPAG